MALLLFGGDLEVAHAEGYVTIDAWIRIRAPAQTAVLVKRLRAALDRLLERQVAAPGAVVEEAGSALVASVVELLVQEEASTQQA
jgi:ATP-dependent RNA helicase DHX29